jgi:hypothetical protein
LPLAADSHIASTLGRPGSSGGGGPSEWIAGVIAGLLCRSGGWNAQPVGAELGLLSYLDHIAFDQERPWRVPVQPQGHLEVLGHLEHWHPARTVPDQDQGHIASAVCFNFAASL